MPGGPEREIPLAVRRFTGVELNIDPAFLRLGALQRCDNWVPDPTYVLTKRLGLALWRTLGAPARIDPLLYATDAQNRRYLVAVAADRIHISVNDGPFAAVVNGTFATAGSPRYGAAVFGDIVYVGNDTDPIKQVPLVPVTQTAVDLTPLAGVDDTGEMATPVEDAASRLLAGTYSYRWAVYDHTAKRWTKVAAVRTVTTFAATRQRLDFRAPSVAVGGPERWHLFVAGVNQEIEGAHDQTPAGLPPSAGAAQFSLWDEPTIDAGAVPMASAVVRRGSRLLAHRGRLWGAGGLGSERRAVWATSVLVPGLEQDIYEQGLFFPAAASTPDLGAPVTALAVAALSSTNRSPTSPLGILTELSTWLYFGDPLDDPGAALIQVSDEIGCMSDRTVASTPIGVLFGGKRSVYLLTPQQAEPRDVGWPIEPAIRAQPTALRHLAWAFFHRGFYKLVLVPPGGITPTEQWWLDLRRGLTEPPSWWGPHTFPPLSAATRAPNHPDEDDRAWGALDATGEIALLDQPGRYIDYSAIQPAGVPIVSRWRTGWLDAEQPLTPKLAKRVRVIARAEGPTALGVMIDVDEMDGASASLVLPVTPGGEWDASDWNEADWTVIGLRLAEFECPVPEPRGRSFAVDVAHADAVRCDLRDFELRVQPSFRETQ